MTWNVLGRPGQEPVAGKTVMVAVSVWVTGALVKAMLPVPEAPRPMAGLSLVQEKVAPGLPLKLTLTVAPVHTDTLGGWLTVGSDKTVMVKVCCVEGQVPPLALTVTVAVCWVPVPEAVKLILPLPEAPRPMAGLLFVQVKELPVPVKSTLTGSPGQTTTLGGSSTLELTVMVKVTGSPGHSAVGSLEQSAIIGVTVMVAV